MPAEFLAQTIAALINEPSAASKIARRIRTVLLLSPACQIMPHHVLEAAVLIAKDQEAKRQKDIPL